MCPTFWVHYNYERLRDAGYEIQCAAEIGYDVVAFITDISNSIAQLDWRQLRDVFQGDLGYWNEIGGGSLDPIFVIVREGSGTTDHIIRQVALLEPSIYPPDGMSNVVTCESNEECLNMSLSIPGSLHGISSSWIRTQPQEFAKVIPVLGRDDERAINPLDEDFLPREYPQILIRPMYLYVLSGNDITDKQVDNARRFLEFVRGVKGQQILEARAFYTYFDHRIDARLDYPEGSGFPFMDGSNIPAVCRP